LKNGALFDENVFYLNEIESITLNWKTLFKIKSFILKTINDAFEENEKY